MGLAIVPGVNMTHTKHVTYEIELNKNQTMDALKWSNGFIWN